MASSSGSGSGGKPSSKGKAPGGVRTLSDLNSRQDSGSDSDSPQEYYTGGEKSGMLVQDPQKNDNNVDSIFERARRMGAQVGPLEQPQAPPSNARNVFSGTARTLGGDTIERRTEESSTASATPTPHHPEVRNITFWTNGFTVDDGPLRRIDDPANAQFLQSISRSECPKELEPEDRNTPVHVNLIRRPEEWKPRPEPKNVAFKGTSRTLGGTSSQAVDGPSNSNILSNTRPNQGLVIEESIPVTSVQLRLADGTRMVARFNHHHTVGQIHDFINAARPDGSRNYQLQVMGFPPRILNNLDETIEQAGIINAVVIQKA